MPRERPGAPSHFAPHTSPFLALGDSYTIGEGVSEEERWPVRLAERLRAAGTPVADPVIVARTGWTTDELAEGMDAAGLKGPYGLVSLLIGVNDQYRGRSVEAYRPAFAGLLARSMALAGGAAGRVFVVSIPDWGVTPFAAAEGRDAAQVGAEIDAFNAAAREESARLGVAFVDVTPVSRRAAADPALLAADGLHPSGRQYEAWVDRVMTEGRGRQVGPHP